MNLFDIADRIREARQEKHLSQQALADGAGLSRPRVALIESGQVSDLQYSSLRSLLRELDLGLRLRPYRGGLLTFEDKIAEREDGTGEWFRTPDIDELSSTVRQARKRLKRTQKAVADAAGISRVSLNRFERGLVDDVLFSNLTQLLSAVDLELELRSLGDARPSYETVRDQDDEDPPLPEM